MDKVYDLEEASWRNDRITDEQVSHLRDLIGQAKSRELEPKQDKDELLQLSRGEADDMIEQLQMTLEGADER